MTTQQQGYHSIGPADKQTNKQTNNNDSYTPPHIRFKKGGMVVYQRAKCITKYNEQQDFNKIGIYYLLWCLEQLIIMQQTASDLALLYCMKLQLIYLKLKLFCSMKGFTLNKDIHIQSNIKNIVYIC